MCVHIDFYLKALFFFMLIYLYLSQTSFCLTLHYIQYLYNEPYSVNPNLGPKIINHAAFSESLNLSESQLGYLQNEAWGQDNF